MDKILSIWLRLTNFHGMNFMDGEGDGGGDGGGGSVAVETGDEGGGEGAEGGEGEESAEEAEGAEETEGDEADGGEEGAAGGKRALSPEKTIEKALNKLRETDPEGAKALRKEFFQTKDYRASFATPQEARQARETIDDLGGSEGITKMRGEVADYATELTRMAEGDPQAVEELARDFPKGLAKLTPHAVDKLATVNPTEYERLVSRHMAKAMYDKGFTHSNDRLIELIADGKQEAAIALARSMREWIKTAEQFGKAPAAAAASDEMSDVEKARQEVATEKANLQSQKVASTVTKTMNGIVEKHLNPLLKGKKLTLSQKQSLARDSFTNISTVLQNKKEYQLRLQALLREGDVNAINRYVGSQVALVAQKSVRQAWADRGFGGGVQKTRTAGAGGNGAGGGSVSMGKKPPADQIDWTKDRSKMRYMAGEATLKNGKIVKWDRNAL